MNKIFLFTAITAAVYCKGQTHIIDSLKVNIQKAGSNEEKLSALFSLCDQGYTLLPDTLMDYASKAKMLANKNGNLHDEVKAMYYQSFALTNKGLIDSSMAVANHCVEILKGKIKDPVLLMNVFNQKGRCYMRKSQYKEAIDMGYQVIEGSEKCRDTLLQIKGKTLVGWAYLEMGQTREALNWHLKALQTTADTLLLEKYGILFANLALNYNGMGMADSALFYISRAISYSRKYENLFALSNSLAIQAQLYVTSGQNKLAEAPLKEVVAIRKLIGDPFYIISDMSQLSLFYAHNGEPEKGITLCKEGIAIAKEYKMDTKLFFLYSTLAENYKAAGNLALYADVLEKILILKDSVYLSNSSTSLAEMQAKYELQKKENLIIKQKLDITRKNNLFYGLLILLLFVAGGTLLVFREYRRKQRIRLKKMQEEDRHISDLAVKEAEENERNRIATDLHDSLGAYANVVLYNAELLQQEEKSFKRDALVKGLQFASKDIITSLRETIWALKNDHYTAEDCLVRIRNFIQPFNRYYPHINFIVNGEVPVLTQLHYSKALHLVRIVQEAVNNSIKHSGAKNILVHSSMDNSKWKLIVRDDGRGFDYAGIKKMPKGNGINNMEQRARASGFGYAIESDQHGTEISIQV